MWLPLLPNSRGLHDCLRSLFSFDWKRLLLASDVQLLLSFLWQFIEGRLMRHIWLCHQYVCLIIVHLFIGIYLNWWGYSLLMKNIRVIVNWLDHPFHALPSLWSLCKELLHLIIRLLSNQIWRVGSSLMSYSLSITHIRTKRSLIAGLILRLLVYEIYLLLCKLLVMLFECTSSRSMTYRAILHVTRVLIWRVYVHVCWSWIL